VTVFELDAGSPWVERLGRLGLAAKGLSFGLVGVLSIEVALGHGGTTTDRQGALHHIAGGTLGKGVLIVLAVGFAGYALWRIADALLDRHGDAHDAAGLAKRASYLGRAAIYAALFYTTLSILVGTGGGGGNNAKRDTSGVLGWPLGRELVAAVALGVAAASLWNGYRAITAKFDDKLETRRMGETATRAAQTLGVAGHLARGVVFGIAAWFLAKAALEQQGKDAVGLDGALARLADQPYGRALLGIVAAGLFAYGVYCLFEARYRDLRA
jgi:hypothetical protein